MTSRRYVNLHIQVDTGNEIIIDNFKANEWDDFIIVSIDSSDQEEFDRSAETISRLLKEAGHDSQKPVIIFPASMEVTLYGVEIEEDARENQG